MNKLKAYLANSKKPSGKLTQSDGEIFPELNEAEEAEIRLQLGIPKTADVSTKDIIHGTLRGFQKCAEDDFMAAGTVRIKTIHGDALGTVRIKEGESEAFIDFFGTFKVNTKGEECLEEGDAPSWADFGSVRITRDDIDSGTVRLATGSSCAYEYRPPEDWELSILSLENGEWAPEMGEDAFGKYRKKRKGLQSIWGEDGAGVDVKEHHGLPRSVSEGAGRRNYNPHAGGLTQSDSVAKVPGGERAWAKYRRDNTA